MTTTDDIVTRLQNGRGGISLLSEAATEIERLRAQLQTPAPAPDDPRPQGTYLYAPQVIRETFDHALHTNDLRTMANITRTLIGICNQMAEAIEIQVQTNRVPVTTRAHYSQHAIDALAAWGITVNNHVD